MNLPQTHSVKHYRVQSGGVNVLKHAGKAGVAAEACVKRSALHVTMQRAVTADAARCDG